MKTLAIVIALIAVLGLLVYTNPSLNDFSNYVRQEVVQESQKNVTDPVGQFLSSIAGGIAGGLVTSQTIRTDYIFFSIYDLQFGKDRLKALGIARNFLLLQKPDWKHYKSEHPFPQ